MKARGQAVNVWEDAASKTKQIMVFSPPPFVSECYDYAFNCSCSLELAYGIDGDHPIWSIEP